MFRRKSSEQSLLVSTDIYCHSCSLLLFPIDRMSLSHFYPTAFEFEWGWSNRWMLINWEYFSSPRAISFGYSRSLHQSIEMGNNQPGGSGNTLRRHIETATKTGVLQYDNKKLKEVINTHWLQSRWSFSRRSILPYVFLVYEHYPWTIMNFKPFLEKWVWWWTWKNWVYATI